MLTLPKFNQGGVIKTVALTIGPQGTGKSTFCKKIISEHPEVIVVSRDQIFLNHFCRGDEDTCLTDFDPRHRQIFAKMWEMVSEKLLGANGINLILDCWNRNAQDRYDIATNLRRLGADTVIAWRFVTPMSVCLAWLEKKHPASPGSDPVIEMAKRAERCRQYNLFHIHKVEISDGFDSVVDIDPNAPPAFGQLF